MNVANQSTLETQRTIYIHIYIVFVYFQNVLNNHAQYRQIASGSYVKNIRRVVCIVVEMSVKYLRFAAHNARTWRHADGDQIQSGAQSRMKTLASGRPIEVIKCNKVWIVYQRLPGTPFTIYLMKYEMRFVFFHFPTLFDRYYLYHFHKDEIRMGRFDFASWTLSCNEKSKLSHTVKW